MKGENPYHVDRRTLEQVEQSKSRKSTERLRELEILFVVETPPTTSDRQQSPVVEPRRARFIRFRATRCVGCIAVTGVWPDSAHWQPEKRVVRC